MLSTIFAHGSKRYGAVHKLRNAMGGGVGRSVMQGHRAFRHYRVGLEEVLRQGIGLRA